MSGINYSPVSRPFVITAVLLSFVGVSIGSVWMLTLLGISVPHVSGLFPLHKIIQLEGFLTILIMGVSYMIIPRFRNAQLPSTKLAVVSFLLVLSSLILESAQRILGIGDLVYSDVLQIGGIIIFASLSLYTIRITPKLLREADYFIILSISVLVLVNLAPVVGGAKTGSLNYIQMWLLFPVLTIFGVKYKMFPSFLGFIRPRKDLTILCILASVVCCVIGGVSLYHADQMLSVAFNAAAILMVGLFAASCYVFGGFDNREILKLMPGEKKARYDMIVRHARIGFSFLAAGFSMGIVYYLQNGFLFYDLAIHYTAIGFVGITIMLFLPLMLPPIIGKTIQFLNFNKVPLILILSALALRTVGDYVIDRSIQGPLSAFFSVSGLVVLAGMLYFVIMIHRSMSEIPSVNVEFKKK